jgi:hypothetical protein
MRRTVCSMSLLVLCGTACLGSGCSSAVQPSAAIPGDTVAASTLARAPRTARSGVLLPSDLVLPNPERQTTERGWLSPEAKTAKKIVYVADQDSGAVEIYSQAGSNQQPIGAITSGIAGVDGLFVDRARNLYACNFGGGTVTVYPAGSTTPSLTLTGAGSPIDVAVARNGTVYVANFASGTNGTVLVYPKGQTSPSKTLVTFGAGSFPEGMTLDSKSNLYVAFNTNDGEVLEFAPNSASGKNLGIHVGYVGGLTIDHSGDLLLVDQNGPSVDVFPPGATEPSAVIKGFGLAFDISIDKSNADIYVTNPFSPPSVDEVSYPAGTIVDTITSGLSSAFGVATSPAAR